MERRRGADADAPDADAETESLRVRTRVVCFLSICLFCIPMYAVLPAMINYIVERRCEAMGRVGHCDDDAGRRAHAWPPPPSALA